MDPSRKGLRMSSDEIAAAVLECVGGINNVTNSSLCATRLRISLADTRAIDRNALHSVYGVLGVTDRGLNGIEVVFGPNLVRGVFHSFRGLTGPMSGHDEPESQSARPQGNFQVTITPATPGQPLVQGTIGRAQTEVVAQTQPIEDVDTNALLDMLDQTGDLSLVEDFDDGMRLLVINGPNINMLGIREPDLYGKADFSELLDLCHQSAHEAGFVECECYQSNHEGDLVDRIQDAYELFDAIVINPGAYTHTSIALLDALKAVGIPTVEVHISDVSTRDDFRQISYVRLACIGTVMGMGIDGYRKAIFDLAEHLGILPQS